MTPVERHAELVYAESLYAKVSPPQFLCADINAPTERTRHRVLCGLACINQGSVSASTMKTTRSRYPCCRPNLRTAMSIYGQLGRYLEAADASDGPLEDPSIDMHFRSGVYLGVGVSHLFLSMMPARLLATIELFGYRVDRREGLRMLYRAGGWDANGERGVVSQGKSLGVLLDVSSDSL